MSQINTRIRIEAAIGVIRRRLAPARPPPWNRASETKQSEIQHACWLQSLDWDRVVAHRQLVDRDPLSARFVRRI